MVLGRIEWKSISTTAYEALSHLYGFEVQFSMTKGGKPLTYLSVEDKRENGGKKLRSYEVQALNGELLCTMEDKEGILKYAPQILGTPGLPPDKRRTIDTILNDLRFNRFKDITRKVNGIEGKVQEAAK